jgi:hypothetical protein
MTLALAVLALTALAAGPEVPRLDTARIEQLTGAKGQLDARENVFKVTVPRSDLQITVGGVKLAAPMGLASWAAFKRVGPHTMVMGDTCLTEDQVNTVMSAALDNGLEVTALHNHFLWDSPRVMFMHVGGTGDPDALATAVGKVFAAIKSTAGGHGTTPTASIDAAHSTIDPKKLDALLGHPGTITGGIYKVVIGRETKMEGHEMGNAMGVNTWAAFAGTDESAVVDGDFAMLESELQGVLKALRHAGINVVAIHQHMSGEQPRILFLHFWGLGKSAELAGGLKAALAQTAVRSMPGPGSPGPLAPR